jgi:hypothetical protein
MTEETIERCAEFETKLKDFMAKVGNRTVENFTKEEITEFANIIFGKTLAVYEVIRVIETEKEMLEGPDYNTVFSGFENVDKTYRLRRPSENFTAFVCDRDPLYDDSKRVFTNYTIDGVDMFQQVSLHCCISNSPLQEVLQLSDKWIVVVQRNWAKCDANFKIFAKSKNRVTNCREGII